VDFDGAGPGGHRASPGPSVAHHQAVAGLVEELGMRLEVGPALGQKGHGDHVLGGHPANLVEAQHSGFFVTNRVSGGVMD